ncbi:MAG: SBBP repeat-containing protein [Candidatus Thorarchaeota archaeon]
MKSVVLIGVLLVSVVAGIMSETNQMYDGRLDYDNNNQFNYIGDRHEIEILPLAFTKNQGQWEEKVKFRADAGGATMWFTGDGAYYQFTRMIDRPKPLPGNLSSGMEMSEVETMMIKASFVGANSNPVMIGEELMDCESNYFIGNDPDKWFTNVPNYLAVVYKDIYAGIDLKYYGNGLQMEYDFIVSPGADLAQIQIQYEGAKSLRVDESGELVVETGWGEVIERQPYVYQSENGVKVQIEARYAIVSENTFGFDIDEVYDPALALVIDPVLTYSTYLGGSGGEGSQYYKAIGLEVDAAGDIYIHGWTGSSNFPTQNPYDGTYAGSYTDRFLTKISADGSSLIYSTYFGGWQLEDSWADIVVEGSGSAIMTGRTKSNDFPLVNPYDSTLSTPINDIDAFITKFSPTGDSLIYSTLLGGDKGEAGISIVLDSSNNVVVTGITSSTLNDFPVYNAFQSTHGGGYDDAFIAKFTSTGSIVFATYFGGSDYDRGYDVAVDAVGDIYLCGYTESTDFPTQYPYQAVKQQAVDGFVTKFTSDGSSLVYSTYLGGGQGTLGDDVCYAIKVDNDYCAYVSGFTGSDNFPVVNPYQDIDYWGDDVFVTKFDSTGGNLIYSTYLGGSGDDYCYDLALDNTGHAYVTGRTVSTNFPIKDSLQADQSGDDAFIAKLTPTGDALAYSTYFGGSAVDAGSAIVVSADGSDVYVAGVTWSTDLTTVNPYDASHNGSNDVFIMKLHTDLNPPIVSDNLSDSGPGSIREALDLANSRYGPDTISFDMSGTIEILSTLPPITDDGTIILGSTAPGGIHSVIIDASALGSGSAISIQSSGNYIEGLHITGAPGDGIEITGATSVNNTITQNLIYGNGELAIDLGADGVTANDVGDADTGPNDLLNYPEIDSTVSQMDETYWVYGQTAPNVVVEFFTAHPARDGSKPVDPSGHGEAWVYVGQATASPSGEFVFHDTETEHFSVLTSTATDPQGNTSEMSGDFMLLPAPLTIVAYVYTPPTKSGILPQNGVNIIVEDPNGDRFGRDSLNVTIDDIPGDQYYAEGPSEDTVVIPDPILGEYAIYIVGESGSETGTLYTVIIKTDGLQECILVIDAETPASGTFDSYTYNYDETGDYLYGDANGDATCNISDAVYVINYVFKGGSPPVPESSGDADCSGTLNVSDAVYIINYVFKGGNPPCSFEI